MQGIDQENDAASFRLKSIAVTGPYQYEIKLVCNDRQVEFVCEVQRVLAEGMSPFDLIKIGSEEFHRLSARGHVDDISLRKAIFAFHECAWSSK